MYLALQQRNVRFKQDPNALESEMKEEVGLEVEIIRPADVWYLVKGHDQLFSIIY